MLTIPQLIALAMNAGFSGSDLITAVAIALAESGGIPTKYNPELKAGAAQGQGSYGLWQIYLTAHPQFDPQQLVADPQYNANAAFQIYQQAGGTFRDWTTYTHGQYQTFVGQVAAAVASSSPAPATNGTTDQAFSAGLVSGDGLTNYWPLLLIAGELLLVFWARG